LRVEQLDVPLLFLSDKRQAALDRMRSNLCLPTESVAIYHLLALWCTTFVVALHASSEVMT
jgi:hypothetical protein